MFSPCRPKVQCFQKYVRGTSNANDAGNASVACAVYTDDAVCRRISLQVLALAYPLDISDR